MAQVKVVAMSDGSVIKQSSNPEFGFVRVAQEIITIENGWINRKVEGTLLNGRLEDLMSLGLKVGSEFPGKLVVEESLEPFNPGPYQDRDIKVAFTGGPVCVYEDMPIYRRVRHTYDMDEQNSLIQHTNKEEIREAVAKRKEQEKLMLASVEENTENQEKDAEETTKTVKAEKTEKIEAKTDAVVTDAESVF